MIEALSEINEYLYSKMDEKDAHILEMEAYAEEHHVPIITKEVAEYIKQFLAIKPCHNALEVGTAIGYSGSYIARGITGELTTIEISEESYNIAKQNFAKAGITNVKQILGDAGEEIKKLDESFDFIFIDAAKGQYQKFFDDSYPMLKEGGIVLIDNILFRGLVALPEEDYPKRYRTLLRKLDAFISYLYKEHNFSLLPFGDGMGIVYKK